MNNSLKFRNGKLRILQVSDPQDLKFVRKAMVRMLDNAYDSLYPDLVVFTGDNILGNHLLDRRIGNGHFSEGKEATLESMKEAIGYICEPLERRKIPFCMIYGNHDDMNPVTKEEQIEIFRSYSMCLDMNVDNRRVDCDTYSVNLTDDEGKVKVNLFMLDSAWQDKDGERKCHCEIKKDTVDWYLEETALLNKVNSGNTVPSFMFLHVPLPDILRLTEECTKESDYAIGNDSDGYFRLNYKLATGYMMEPPSVVDTDNGLFKAIVGEGNVRAIVNGHDHLNNFIGRIDGVDMISTGCASFRCYGDIRTRGVRLFEIGEDGSYTTRFFRYPDLCGDSLASKLMYFNDADELAVKKWITVGAAGLAAAVSAMSVVAAKKIIK